APASGPALRHSPSMISRSLPTNSRVASSRSIAAPFSPPSSLVIEPLRPVNDPRAKKREPRALAQGLRMKNEDVTFKRESLGGEGAPGQLSPWVLREPIGRITRERNRPHPTLRPALAPASSPRSRGERPWRIPGRCGQRCVSPSDHPRFNLGSRKEPSMAIEIGPPQGTEQLRDFLLFHDTVYAERGARWTAFLPLQLPILEGQSPFTRDRTIRPFWARENGKIIARVLAVIDERYRRHWQEPTLGHLVLFEALPETRVAVRQMMDAACEWLAGHQSDAARTGFGMLEFPFVIDAYEPLSPPFTRQNPAYYHSLLKDGRVQSGRGG